MKSILFKLILVVTAIVLYQCKKESIEHYKYDFQFITEIYKPFNYTEAGEITGLAPDLLKEICQNLNIPFDVSVKSWDEGYNLAQTTPGAVLFSTSMNSQRKELFKWAGPIASIEWKFYALAQNQITFQSLDDARKVRAIGVLKDYTIEQFLVKNGFTNLIYCKDHQDAINKLLKEEIDLYPSDRFTTEATLEILGKSIYNLKEVLPIKTEMIYYAFNKMTPDEVVADFQQEIDQLKNNGFLKSLYQKYLNSSDFPGTLVIYTEEYPPITFLGTYGEITGYGADVVKEIMKRNRIFENIKISTWSNGYELALDNPNFCLFTMDRTEIRNSLFQWVGPVGTNTTWFYVRKGSGITISSLVDAKKLASVGTVSSWFSDQYLRTLGFNNLVSGNEPVEMAVKLMKGEINAFVCTGVTFPDILNKAGYHYSEVSAAFALMSSDYYISFSKTTSSSIAGKWQTTWEAMVSDGTVAAIRKRWFPD
jgi:ABC-type amino acid transport substrate-binding protein